MATKEELEQARADLATEIGLIKATMEKNVSLVGTAAGTVQVKLSTSSSSTVFESDNLTAVQRFVRYLAGTVG